MRRRLRELRGVGRRAISILWAFLAMGYRTAMAYPANFVLSQIQPLSQVLIFYFVAQLVDRSGPAVGGDYFTFVVVGWIAVQMLQAGLNGFTAELSSAVQQGRFEMLLVEPVRWRLLPLGLLQWPVIQRTFAVLVLFVVSALLGANYRLAGVAMSIPVLLLGVLAALAIGVLAGSVVVLAKRGNPVMVLYNIAAALLSGALFPLDLLPNWLRPLSWLVPQTYVVAALRRVLMPDGSILPGPSFTESLLGLTVFTAVALPLALWVFGRAMQVGRKMGVLSGY